MQFKHAQLDNGLHVVAELSESAQSAAVGFFVRTGSRDESPQINGVSHFLEHMVFKGTDTLDALTVNRVFDKLGAKYNAYTSQENTIYFAAVLPEFLLDVLRLWAALMRPALRQEDFDGEKNVILEEIAMYRDEPSADVMDKALAVHFGDHPLGRSALGSTESVSQLTRQQMLAYHASRYVPNNMVLAAAGRFEWDRFLAQARELCGDWPPGQVQRDLTEPIPTRMSKVFKKDNVARQHVVMLWPGPSAQDRYRFAANILARIVGDYTGSRLYWALVDPGKADVAEMSYDQLDHAGLFSVYVSCDPERASEVVEIARDVIRRLQRQPVTEEELRCARNKAASSLVLKSELPMGRLMPVGLNWVYRRQYRSTAEDLREIQAVSHDDIATLLQRYLSGEASIAALGPREQL